MSMDAVALLRLSLDQLGEVLRVEDETDEGTTFRVMGRSLVAKPLKDCCSLDLAFRFDTPESTLGSVLRRDLGELIEAHGDERGVYVYPSVVSLEADTYEAALEELGEGGMWISVPAADQARVGPGDAMGVFQGLAAGLGPDMLGQIQQMMGSLQQGAPDDGQADTPEGSAPGMAGMPEGFAEIASGMLQNPEMRGMLEGMAAQLFGQAPGADGAAPAADDLLTRAREMAEQASEENPELAAQLEKLAGEGAKDLDPETVKQLAAKLGVEADEGRDEGDE